MDKFSYALGLGIGQQLKQMGLKGQLVINDFAQSTSIPSCSRLKRMMVKKLLKPFRIIHTMRYFLMLCFLNLPVWKYVRM